jgi:hypothetical protein
MRGASLGDDAEDEPVMAIRVGISLVRRDPGVGIG